MVFLKLALSYRRNLLFTAPDKCLQFFSRTVYQIFRILAFMLATQWQLWSDCKALGGVTGFSSRLPERIFVLAGLAKASMAFQSHWLLGCAPNI